MKKIGLVIVAIIALFSTKNVFAMTEAELTAKVKAIYDINGQLLAVYGQNEFEEPSYIYYNMGSNEVAFYYKDFQNNHYYNENHLEISYDNMADSVKNLPRA